MAKKEAKKEEIKFNEFKFSGETFEYSGRVYPKKSGETKGKVTAKWYVQLVLNDVLTIKGCYLVETKDDYFLTFPQYKKDDSFESYIYIVKDMNTEIEELTAIIYRATQKLRKGGDAE